jgi:threonine synthase
VSRVVGLRCAVCGATVDIGVTHPWRCPRAGADRRHVLRIVRAPGPFEPGDDANPFVAYAAESAWAAYAEAHGMRPEARSALVLELDAAVADVAGTGFRRTPLNRNAALSDALGFSAQGGVWVKDETGNVAGSHKARHLLPILLHLRAAEVLGRSGTVRPPLAIASCGNAALAAATLAAAVRWPIAVHVPPDANPAVLARLTTLGAQVVTCPRRDDDPPGDPCVHRFREAVAAGAIPFSVQGPENALCLDGGRTLGFEIVERLGDAFDRVFVQVGGGALATGIGDALAVAGIGRPVHAVQTEACAPLARAWTAAAAFGDDAPAHWAACMWPWEHVGASAASGILDDETYDWVGVWEAMRRSGGSPVVVSEDTVAAADALTRGSGIDADPTGSAGLAGVLALRPQLADDERVLVVFSGVRR